MTDRIADYVAGNEPAFKKWMAAVDKSVDRKLGVSVMDLPDLNFWDLWKDGVSAGKAANMAIKEAGG